MNHSTILLSCGVHSAHEQFANTINAKIKNTPFFSYFYLIKKFRFIEIFFPFIAFIYTLFIYIKEDVLLVEGSGMLYIAAFLKFKQRNLKIIYLDADTFFYEIHKKNRKPKIFKYTLQAIDGIISVSETNKKYAEKYVNKPIVVAPPPPKEVQHIELLRKNYGLYVGRLDPEKNIHSILAFAEQCPHLEKIIVIGSGIYSNYVKSQAEKKSKIIYLGPILDDRELFKHYSTCKFFLNFSTYDSYPCTILEAALSNCFPLLPKHIGNSHLFDELFVFEDMKNFEDINKKIYHILNNEASAKQSLKKSQEKILTKNAALKNFQKTFEELINTIYLKPHDST